MLKTLALILAGEFMTDPNHLGMTWMDPQGTSVIAYTCKGGETAIGCWFQPAPVGWALRECDIALCCFHGRLYVQHFGTFTTLVSWDWSSDDE